MINYNKYQQRLQQFNLSQTKIGSTLKTLKGSKIQRRQNDIGKQISTKVYFHKDYLDRIVSEESISIFLTKAPPFEFNCLRFNIMSNELSFVECPDFDTAREPTVGRIFTVDFKGRIKLNKSYNCIYHHKWMFVDNSYKGFDVEESWNWSRTWLNILTEPADGSNLQNWMNQLARFGLK